MSWTCPHCKQPQVVSGSNHDSGYRSLDEGYEGNEQAMFAWSSTRCLNVKCKKRTLEVSINRLGPLRSGSMRYLGDKIRNWRLIPQSYSKSQPSYIPDVITADYYEACLIRDLSPKASATLSRRCLQGMIRDFCGISRNRLVDEIKELKRLVESSAAPRGVDEDAVSAIDAVRKIGNIGAHMEKDIGVIVDVDPDEAQVLIELIESLFEEWYVAKHAREQRFSNLHSIAEAKTAAKNPAEAPAVEREPLANTDFTPEG